MTIQPPWRPMSEAPRDGTTIVVLYGDLSGTANCFWGEYRDDPSREGWFEFIGNVEDYAHTDEALIDDAYGWIPLPIRV